MDKRIYKAAVAAVMILAMSSCANKDTPKETVAETAAATVQTEAVTSASSAEITTEAQTEQSTQETAEAGDGKGMEELVLTELKDFKVTDSSGEEKLLSEIIKGKPAIVNFWATWCPPCLHELPYYEKCYKEYGDDIQFIMIDDYEKQEDVEKFLEYNDYTFPVYYYTSGDVRQDEELGLRGVPVTLFYDENGEIRGSLRITFQAEADLKKFIDVMSAGDYDGFDDVYAHYLDLKNGNIDITLTLDDFLIQDVPDLTLLDGEGATHTMSGLAAEKPVVFYFFDPSIEEYNDQNIKNMIESVEGYGDAAELVLVSTGKEREETQELFDELGIDYPFYSHNGKSLTRLLNIDYGQALISMDTDGKPVCTLLSGCYDPEVFPKFMDYTIAGDSEGWKEYLVEIVNEINAGA